VVPEQDTTRRPYVDRIHQAARRGATLTRQLLAFSRRQETRPRPVDLEELTAETGNMIQRLIGEDILFEPEVEPGIGSIAADPGQLQQILLNLAVNAADAMPRGGRLTLRWTREVVPRELRTEAGPLAPGAYVALEVEDTGEGMDAATRQRIFEPFFTTKETGKGTGLGLSTVFGIVQQWRGGITVRSEPGAGTLFRLLFPAAERSADAAEPRSVEPAVAPASTAGGSETVLLVEDDGLFRGLLQSVLEANGYRVLAAGGPPEAMNLFVASARTVDLLVSDLVMPGGSGIELAGALRARTPGLRVVLMSGYSDEALASRDLDNSAADAFLEKPFAIEELLRTVRAVLGGPAGGA
jgi:CheY-like chemotaxis protein